jgi:serralysin
LQSTDTVYGLDGNDRLDGGSENDLIDGGNGSDTIIGGTGDDTMVAGAGNNSLSGGAGNDSITGGADLDWLTYAELTAASQAVTVDLFSGMAMGAGGVDALAGIENVITGAGNDVVLGSELANALSTGAGNDSLAGGIGADTLDAGAGADTLSGGAGNDSIAGGNDVDWLTYAELTEASQAVTIDLVTGRASGAAGADTITGIENLLTGAGNDSLLGDSLANMLSASAGNDTLSGGDGNDTLDGGLGNDSLTGGAGNDVFIVNSAGDVVRDTAGTDTILLRAASINLAFVNVENVFGDLAGQAFSITGNNAATNLVGGSLNDSIYALQSTDTVYGLDGNDRLDGGSENDLIDGGNGSDTIIGGTGDDTVVSGLGNDSLNGGSGADHFIFNTALGTANVDRIQSYNVTDDTILLDDAIFTALGSPGALAAGAFKAGAAATDADDRIIYNATTGALFYDQDGNGATAAVQFATLTSITGTITHADFLII